MLEEEEANITRILRGEGSAYYKPTSAGFQRKGIRHAIDLLSTRVYPIIGLYFGHAEKCADYDSSRSICSSSSFPSQSPSKTPSPGLVSLEVE